MAGLLESPTTSNVQTTPLAKQTSKMDLSAIDETTSTSSENSEPTATCDACPCCADVCDISDCVSCKEKSVLYCLAVSSKVESASSGEKSLKTFTLCQVKRHNHKDSAWIVANNAVYDVTSYLSRHPAGAACILSVAGGQDCTQGYKRHKYFARQKFEQFRIGTLKKCEGAKRGLGITGFLQRACSIRSLCSSNGSNKQ